MWIEHFEGDGVAALLDIPRPGRPPKAERGRWNIYGRCIQVEDHSRRAAKHTPKDRCRAPQHVCQKAHVPVRLGPQGRHHGACQSRRRQDSKRMEVSRKKAHFTSKSDRIRDTDRGRDLLHTQHWIRAQVLVPCKNKDNRSVHWKSQKSDGIRRCHKRRGRFLEHRTQIQRGDIHLAGHENKAEVRKVAVILDKAPQHRSKVLRKRFGRNRDVKFVYFPRGSPYLNMLEEY